MYDDSEDFELDEKQLYEKTYKDTFWKLAQDMPDEEIQEIEQEILSPELNRQYSNDGVADCRLNFEKAKHRVETNAGLDDHSKSFLKHVQRKKGMSSAQARKWGREEVSSSQSMWADPRLSNKRGV